MKTILVWILINLSTGQPVANYQFPTQADCLRAGSTFSTYAKVSTRYTCTSLKITSLKIVDPYTDPVRQYPQAPEDRARSNYNYEQDKINQILEAGTTR